MQGWPQGEGGPRRAGARQGPRGGGRWVSPACACCVRADWLACCYGAEPGPADWPVVAMVLEAASPCQLLSAGGFLAAAAQG